MPIQDHFYLSPKLRSLGRARFIWQYGIIRFGVPVALLGEIVRFVLSPGEFAADPVGALVGYAVRMVSVTLVTGYLAGRWVWRLDEKNRERDGG